MDARVSVGGPGETDRISVGAPGTVSTRKYIARGTFVRDTVDGRDGFLYSGFVCARVCIYIYRYGGRN